MYSPLLYPPNLANHTAMKFWLSILRILVSALAGAMMLMSGTVQASIPTLTTQLCRYSEQESGDTLYAYDAAGQLKDMSQGEAVGTGCGSMTPVKRTTMYYDILGQNFYTDIWTNATQDIIKTFDANGNLTSLVRGLGSGGVGTCSCDGYSEIGQCLTFAQRKTLVDQNGREFNFQAAGSLRGMRVDGEVLDVNIVESEQGISFYSKNPNIAIFLPRTVAINSVQFVEKDCRFVFERKVVTEDRYYHIRRKSLKIKSPVDFSVESICNQQPINSYTINGALGLRDIVLSDGRHFRLKTQE